MLSKPINRKANPTPHPGTTPLLLYSLCVTSIPNGSRLTITYTTRLTAAARLILPSIYTIILPFTHTTLLRRTIFIRFRVVSNYFSINLTRYRIYYIITY